MAGSERRNCVVVFIGSQPAWTEQPIEIRPGVPQNGGNVLYAKYGGLSGGSPLSGGGIIILHVIRRHFLAAAVDPAVSLATYNRRPMEAVP